MIAANGASGASLTDAVVVRADGPTRATLHIAGERIASVAPTGAFTIDLAGHLIFPGLVNAHDHLGINAVPPLPAGPPFPNSYAWAAEFGAHFRDPQVADAVAVPVVTRCWQGALKNLLAGTTTVANHDPWTEEAFGDEAFPVRLLRRFAWCHSLGMSPRRGLRGKLLARAARLFGRPAPFGPAAVESFTATPPGAPWIIHLAEGTDAMARGELRQLDALGCLAANTVVVHGVGLSADDVEWIIGRGAAVIWCPASNLAVLGATLSPRRLAGARRLALGTDSRLTGFSGSPRRAAGGGRALRSRRPPSCFVWSRPTPPRCWRCRRSVASRPGNAPMR